MHIANIAAMMMTNKIIHCVTVLKTAGGLVLKVTVASGQNSWHMQEMMFIMVADL